MFNKLFLAVTITFSLNYFLGISSTSLQETKIPLELQIAQTQVTTLLASVDWSK
ncbi:hypothetical protein ACKFKG_15410 [Phormidesmis sp. 146-35]